MELGAHNVKVESAAVAASASDVWVSRLAKSWVYQQKTSVPSQQTLFVCQKQAKGPTHGIATDLDNRTVTFQTDHTPQDRIAVRF